MKKIDRIYRTVPDEGEETLEIYYASGRCENVPLKLAPKDVVRWMETARTVNTWRKNDSGVTVYRLER